MLEWGLGTETYTLEVSSREQTRIGCMARARGLESCVPWGGEQNPAKGTQEEVCRHSSDPILLWLQQASSHSSNLTPSLEISI